MTKELANEIETFLTKKLTPEHGFVLLIGETETSHSGIISNYPGETVVKILKECAHIAYASNPGELN
jgi:hypothetical protein